MRFQLSVMLSTLVGTAVSNTDIPGAYFKGAGSATGTGTIVNGTPDTTGGNNVNSAACLSYCVTNAAANLIGFTYVPSTSCACISSTDGGVITAGSGTPASAQTFCYGCESDAPSAKPSEQPSRAPSEKPSTVPSKQPSESPSTQPSKQPSGQPSRAPSESPSTQPSKQPSEQPTRAPSESPSSQPSENPSSMPSGRPSGQPSSVPSENPSSQPSGQPSSSPSSMPSGQPSSMPSGQPSSSPSSMPSGQPSSMPSGQPSSSPSSMPSGQPSSMPSGQPSSSPSSMPSGQPSSMPSGQPSSSPSSMPSGQPSSIPSGQPSSSPSSMPSGRPSSMPSGQPSSMPSGQPSSVPSGQPSSSPSAIPSAQPSLAPSTQPSSQPSAQPSCTPSMSPTNPATTFLFYPDWSPSGAGCLNDGKEPGYMSASPGDHMHSSLDSCCSTYFGWNFNECSGNLPGVCARSLFYPDWEGSNEGCIDDGNEPRYITDNAMWFMFTKLEECCETHYKWNYNSCVGKKGLQNAELFYPDWDATDATKDSCKDGGGQPPYMNNNPDVWMHKTLAGCCTEYFSWTDDTCVGSAPTTTPGTVPGAGKYYPNWSNNDHMCSNDGKQPSYMTNNQDVWMYNDLKDCCNERYPWNYNLCVASASSGSTPTVSGSNKYYMSWSSKKCVKDCVGTGCGGLASKWDIPYDDLKTCCAQRNWWNKDCNTI